jgi:hypothetical protein
MTREVAMVFDKEGRALYWLDGSSGAAVPDSRSLWDVLWENRENLGGVAHTHPWDGPTSPSGTDLTTFAAIEAGLGKKLIWPIITMTHEHYFLTSKAVPASWAQIPPPFAPPPFDSQQWAGNIEKLRQLSRGELDNQSGT